jgi:hypothetical protein
MTSSMYLPVYRLVDSHFGTTELRCIRDIFIFKRILSNSVVNILRRLTYNNDVIGVSNQ